MPQQERKKGVSRSRELLASLDVKGANRQPILNDGLVAKIGVILGQATVVKNDNNLFFEMWHLTTPDGIILEFCAFPTRRGRVISADILAHDSVRISFKENEEAKTVYMKGICSIGLVRGVDGSSAIEFVQRTDKCTRTVEVSDKEVIIGGNGSATSIPRRFVKDFSFFQ